MTEALEKTEQVTPATQPEQTVAPNPELRFEFSPSIGKLVEALAKAQDDFKPIKKESSNPFFKSKYADLAAVIDATRKSLSRNGLAIIQPPCFDRTTGTVEIITLLAHSSGEWIKAILDMPVSKTDAQGVGSAITYGRRYARSAVLDVASEEDDDGNAAVSEPRKSRKEVEENTERADYLKVFEIQAIDDAIKSTGKSEEEVKAYLSLIGTDRIEHIQRSGFKATLTWANSKRTTVTVKPASQIPTPDPIEKARKRMWATASEYKIPEGDVKQCIREKYKVQSSKDLTVQQYDEMTQWIKEVAASVEES